MLTNKNARHERKARNIRLSKNYAQGVHKNSCSNG